ncbi:MAG TPA: 2-phospho-L-lactate transferase [Ktedonobacterales bacterium]|jgi:LPPG:FO 2-phospho-L-lactate transferase
MIVTLAGGVGAARFLEGLARVVPPASITVIVNTGDDIDLYGLRISPDLDIVMYTLAGLVDPKQGWGIQNDTYHCLDTLKSYGHDPWFLLGDRDLATHIHRTLLLNQGRTLTEVSDQIRRSLSLETRFLPMSDERVTTRILTPGGSLHFEEYLVQRHARDPVQTVEFAGIEAAHPAPGVLEAIAEAEAIILAPSNPIVSIGSILAVPGVRAALRQTPAPVVAISPIVGGATIKGPADKLMSGLGLEVSARGVADYYRDFLDVLIIDQVDAALAAAIEAQGQRVMVMDTIMRGLPEKEALARAALAAIQ